MAELNKAQKFARDIKGLRESIELNARDLASLDLTSDERQGIRDNSQWCARELADLVKKLDAEEAGSAKAG